MCLQKVPVTLQHVRPDGPGRCGEPLPQVKSSISHLPKNDFSALGAQHTQSSSYKRIHSQRHPGQSGGFHLLVLEEYEPRLSQYPMIRHWSDDLEQKDLFQTATIPQFPQSHRYAVTNQNFHCYHVFQKHGPMKWNLIISAKQSPIR